MNAEIMKQMLQDLKNEAQNLLKENKVKEAEEKTLEAKILNAKIEIQEKLDEANTSITDFNNKVSELTSNLETVNGEKEELMNKYNEAINTITELNEKVSNMQPIVDEHNKTKYEEKLNIARETYKAKFEKVNGCDVFESEGIQNLILETINEDKNVANKAKYELSEKIMEIFDSQNQIDISNIQELTVENKNLNPEVDEFESTYGFKKQ
ncbi:hypothetical protein ACR77J_08050 [Tissierella praeacuta]|uniref:hypothetical protein n=1 Tax=Tissierella praeacuta TaxID=43131 RepID=UPI003DA348FF